METRDLYKERKKETYSMKIRKLVALCAAMALALVGCGIAVEPANTNTTTNNDNQTVQESEGTPTPDAAVDQGGTQEYDVLGMGNGSGAQSPSEEVNTGDGFGMYVCDENGKPLPDVCMLVCDDSTCVLSYTDNEGYLDLSSYNGTMQLHVYMAPDGYYYDEDVIYEVDPGQVVTLQLGDGMPITNARIGSDSESDNSANNNSSNDSSGDSAQVNPNVSVSDLTLTFSTTDRSGNKVTSDIFADYKYTVINIWEPWCGPCVSEMPDLEKIYKNYKSQGVNMIGVYSTETDADDVIEETGVTYQMLHSNSDFSLISNTGYIPDTVVVDSQGRLVYLGDLGENAAGYVSNPSEKDKMLYSCISIGSRSYSDWSGFLDEILGK